jgi:hypothetical protein
LHPVILAFYLFTGACRWRGRDVTCAVPACQVFRFFKVFRFHPAIPAFYLYMASASTPCRDPHYRMATRAPLWCCRQRRPMPNGRLKYLDTCVVARNSQYSCSSVLKSTACVLHGSTIRQRHGATCGELPVVLLGENGSHICKCLDTLIPGLHTTAHCKYSGIPSYRVETSFPCGDSPVVL